MSRWIAIVLSAVVGMTISLPAAAQWKWKDRAGQTQYSDLPPPQTVPDQDILQRPAGARRPSAPLDGASAASAPSAPPLAIRASDPELEARRKKVEQDQLDKKKAEDAKVVAAKASNCALARENLRTIDSGMRMTRTNEKGEMEYLDDAARAAAARRVRETISADCQ